MIADIITSTFDLGIVVFISFLITYVAAYKLLNDYFITKIHSRLLFSYGLVFYGAGHFIWALNYFNIFKEELILPVLFLYVNLSGGVAMTFFLMAGLEDYLSGQSKVDSVLSKVAKYVISVFWIVYFVITFLFAFVLPPKTDLMFLVQHKDRGTVFNMSVWATWLLIIPSLILASVYFKKRSFVFKDHNSSFYISLYFVLYAILLFIWPYEKLKYAFYFGKTSITLSLFWGVRELATESLIKEKMRAAERDRAFFLDLLTHDIKNYLNTISMALGLMEFSQNTSEVTKIDEDSFDKHKDTIKTTLERTSKLLDDINRFRRITDSIKNNNKELYPVNLQKRLLQTVKDIESSYPSQNNKIRVKFDSSSQEYVILGNELIDVIFNNLITNSIKHNNKKQSIVDIEVSHCDNYIQVIISDNGKGISDALATTLFKKTIKRNGRTRFGCQIVGEIINWYDGTITVDPTYENGARVILRLKTV